MFFLPKMSLEESLHKGFMQVEKKSQQDDSLRIQIVLNELLWHLHSLCPKDLNLRWGSHLLNRAIKHIQSISFYKKYEPNYNLHHMAVNPE